MKFLRVNILILPGILAIIFYGLTVQVSAKKKPKKGKYPPAKQYNVTEAASKIEIDGIADEVAWQRAVKIDLPYEWTPGDNIPAPVKAECLVTFSKTKLFIGFLCFDPDPAKICAHLMDRDNIKGFFNQLRFVGTNKDKDNDEKQTWEFSREVLSKECHSYHDLAF